MSTVEIVAFTVRLPADEHRKLLALAEAGHRPLNAQVRMLLVEGLERHKAAA